MNKPGRLRTKLYVTGAVVAGCALAASVIVMRARMRMRSSAELRLQQEDDLRTWVGEGGKPAPVGVTAHPL